MNCTRCNREIAAAASFCQFCGAGQHQQASAAAPPKPLRRSIADRRLSGVCGGIARYLDTDPVFIRVAWAILSIVPGTILLGVLAYVVAWLVVPEAEPESEPPVAGRKRLERSATDVTVAGVCGGIAEYFAVDATAVRVTWVLLSIFPGILICGLLAYAAAWLIMPSAAESLAGAPPAPPPVAEPDAAPAGPAE